MGRYIVRRLLQIIPVFIGATLLIFIMVSATGDGLDARAGQRRLDPAVRQQLVEQYHLNDNVFVRYLYYMKGVVTLDFGNDYSGRKISEIMSTAFPVTIKLALVALAVEILIGIPIGLLVGLRRGGLLEASALLSTLVVIAIPIFVLGFIAQLFLAVRWGWFSPTVAAGAPLQDLLLPGLVLGSLSVAYVLRLTRTSVVENVRADYVRTATSKGLTRRRVVSVHLLRNSLIPVVTYLGADLGNLMAGAIVTEGIFNVPGVGGALFKATKQSEAYTVVAFVTVLVMVYLLANLAVDLLYAALDPRIRYS